MLNAGNDTSEGNDLTLYSLIFYHYYHSICAILHNYLLSSHLRSMEVIRTSFVDYVVYELLFSILFKQISWKDLSPEWKSSASPSTLIDLLWRLDASVV
jgi:hypothetical protein